MSADFSHIRKLLADRRLTNDMKIGVPRPVLFALMGLVDQPDDGRQSQEPTKITQVALESIRTHEKIQSSGRSWAAST